MTVVSALPLANWLGWYAFVAFSEGKRLDEISQIQEKAKRPYQKVVAVFVGAGFGIVVCILVAFIMKIFL